MAFKGHRRQGYAILTCTTDPDGTDHEVVGKGKITSHVVSFTGSKSDTEVPVWAGDVKDLTESAAEGSVQLVLDQLELEDEAALGGHKYEPESKTLTEAEGDKAPFVRYAAIGTGTRKNDGTGKQETYYRLVRYGKVQFGPVDDVFKTKESSPAFEMHNAQGTCYHNVDGMMRGKTDFDTFQEALTAMKTFLNVT